MDKKIKLGKNIINSIFKGNPFKQLAVLREENWANDVIIDKLLSHCHKTHNKIYNDKDYNKSLEIKKESREYNKLINEKIKQDS